MQTIFEPFQQESKEVNYSYGGLGLGLSIVKKTIEMLGSKINIESKKGLGTKLFFTLKLKTIKIETDKPSDDKNIIKVLLVEDNKINQILTKKIITNKGYFCDIANNGLEAVNMSKESRYNIIFMDIMMPIMNGFEATIAIKKNIPEIPIIALSSISEELNFIKIDDANFNYFLNKPTSPKMIYETIDEFVII